MMVVVAEVVYLLSSTFSQIKTENLLIAAVNVHQSNFPGWREREKKLPKPSQS